MSDIIHARSVSKSFGNKLVLENIDLSVSKGEVIGLIGPNGAGKTTLLKSILGLAPFDGELSVLGLNPQASRKSLMQRVSFIADTAILPSWIRVSEAIEFISNTHPNFNKEKACSYLESTNISLDAKVRELSKGMITKTHLSIIMAIDSELLVLDEPTLGLDIVKRKEFYQQLLGDYFDDEKTIIITTHQVEEIENILTRAVFINDGRIILDESTESIEDHYFEVQVEEQHLDKAQAMNPIYSTKGIRGANYIFRSESPESLSALGAVKKPSLADLFVAKVSR